MTIFPNTARYVELRAKRTRGEITETELFNGLWKVAVEENYRTVAEKNAAYAALPFSVDSGKLEYDGPNLCKNSKYGESFLTLEDALAAHAKNSSYPYNDLSVKSGDFIYEIDPVRTHRRDKETGFFMFCNPDGDFVPDDDSIN